MKKQKILVEKGANAKVVFRGVVIEIKKVGDQEVELIFPENLNHEELLRYLESFGFIKTRKVKNEKNNEKNDEINKLDSEREEKGDESLREEKGDESLREDNSFSIEDREATENTITYTEEKEKQMAARKRKRKTD